MAGGVFISYRREDAAGAAGRIFDHLSARFGREQIFMDVDGIEPGLDFVEVLNARVSGCDVLIAVIGRDWLKVTDNQGQRRIDLDNDFVRIEVAAALERNVRVIPVLVDDARMPAAEELPERLRPLARRNAFAVSHARFSAEMQTLSDVLARVINPGAAPTRENAHSGTLRAADVSCEAILIAARAGHNGTNIFVSPSIPPDRETNGRFACQVPAEEICLVLCDFTLLGNARDALVITDRALHAYHSGAEPRLQSIPFETFRNAPLKKKGWWLIDVGDCTLSTAGGAGPETVIALLSAVQVALQKR